MAGVARVVVAAGDRDLSLPEAPLTLTEAALQTLRQAAGAMGVDEARLASDLLETIASKERLSRDR
jgi:hypothetical protein